MFIKVVRGHTVQQLEQHSNRLDARFALLQRMHEWLERHYARLLERFNTRVEEAIAHRYAVIDAANRDLDDLELL